MRAGRKRISVHLRSGRRDNGYAGAIITYCMYLELGVLQSTPIALYQKGPAITQAILKIEICVLAGREYVSVSVLAGAIMGTMPLKKCTATGFFKRKYAPKFIFYTLPCNYRCNVVRCLLIVFDHHLNNIMRMGEADLACQLVPFLQSMLAANQSIMTLTTSALQSEKLCFCRRFVSLEVSAGEVCFRFCGS